MRVCVSTYVLSGRTVYAVFMRESGRVYAVYTVHVLVCVYLSVDAYGGFSA